VPRPSENRLAIRARRSVNLAVIQPRPSENRPVIQPRPSENRPVIQPRPSVTVIQPRPLENRPVIPPRRSGIRAQPSEKLREIRAENPPVIQLRPSVSRLVIQPRPSENPPVIQPRPSEKRAILARRSVIRRRSTDTVCRSASSASVNRARPRSIPVRRDSRWRCCRRLGFVRRRPSGALRSRTTAATDRTRLSARYQSRRNHRCKQSLVG